MNTFSSFFTAVAKSIAYIGVVPLIPLVALMWCLALMSQGQDSKAISEVA